MTAVRPTLVTSRARGTALIVFASCCFGTSGPMAKAAMDAGLTPQQVASVRICVAALLLLAGTALFRGRALRVRRREVPLLLAYGVVGVAVVQLLYFVAVSRLPIGVAMLLEYLSPVLVTLWVRFVRRTTLPAAVWLGVGLAVTGLCLVAKVWDGLALDTVGVIAGLGTAASSAAYYLLGERAVAASDPVGMTAWGLVVGAVVMIAIDPPWTIAGRLVTTPAHFGPLTLPLWQLLLALAVIATVVAYLASMAAMRHLPSAVVSVLGLLEPVTATVLAWALLGQALSGVQAAGGAVLLAGAVVVQLNSRRVRPGSPSARSSAAADTSPPPSGPPPAAPPARSGACP
ncbi:MAG TPA: EamA family transporter [Pseudonocardiaceae bacterium]|nr:EamA family transporter [Pseudonocardiaceae bacterium]